MLAGIIVYFLFALSLLIVDMVIVKLACKKKAPFVKSETLRYLRGLEMITGLFLLTIMELVVYQVGEVTLGFVHNTTIIYGVLAIIYIADFVYNLYKYKDYAYTLSRLPKSALVKEDLQNIVKFQMQDVYILRTSFCELQEEFAQENFENKQLNTQFNVRLGMAIFVIIALICSIVAMTMGANVGR